VLVRAWGREGAPDEEVLLAAAEVGARRHPTADQPQPIYPVWSGVVGGAGPLAWHRLESVASKIDDALHDTLAPPEQNHATLAGYAVERLKVASFRL